MLAWDEVRKSKEEGEEGAGDSTVSGLIKSFKRPEGLIKIDIRKVLPVGCQERTPNTVGTVFYTLAKSS